MLYTFSLGQQTRPSQSHTPASDQMRNLKKNRSRPSFGSSVAADIREFLHKCKEKASATKASWKKGNYFTAIAGGACKILCLCIFVPVYVALIVAIAPIAPIAVLCE